MNKYNDKNTNDIGCLILQPNIFLKGIHNSRFIPIGFDVEYYNKVNKRLEDLYNSGELKLSNKLLVGSENEDLGLGSI